MSQETESAPVEAQDVSNEALLAELSRLDDEGNIAESSEEAPAEEASESTETSEDDDAKAETTDEVETEAAEESEDDVDAETAKRLEQIQRQERRAKEAVAKERAEFEKERQSWQKEREEWAPQLEEFRRARGRAKYDPAAVLTALGLDEEDFDQAAKQIYALSKSGRENPALREQSTKSLAEREYRSKLEALEAKHEQLLKSIETRQQQEASERQVAQYMGSVEKAIGDDAVLIKRLLDSDPEEARTELRDAAEHLFASTGEVPDPKDVVAHLEKQKRAKLKKLGIEVPAAGSKAATKTNTPAKANETKAKTLSNDIGNQTQSRTEPATDEEIDNEILRAMKEGSIEL